MNEIELTYNLYQQRVTIAVKSHLQWHGKTAITLAEKAGIKPSNLYAKLCGLRHWSLRDLIALGECGVRIPPAISTSAAVNNHE